MTGIKRQDAIQKTFSVFILIRDELPGMGFPIYNVPKKCLTDVISADSF